MASILDWLWGPKDPKHKGVHAGRPGAHKGNRAAVKRQANRNAPRYVASVPAVLGSWVGDRRSANTRAQLASRPPVRNTYGPRGECYNPVQHAGKQYSAWWGKR